MDGSADHYILQMSNQKDGNSLSEERWYYCVDTEEVYTLPKKAKAVDQKWYEKDFWYVSGKFDNYVDCELEDYKRTSVWNFVYNPEGKPEYHRQLNIHAYILELLGFEVKKCRIVMILKDYQKSKQFDSGYPNVPIQDINIPVWESSKTLEFIESRVDLFKEASELADNEIPACFPEERWYKEGKVAVMKEGRKSALKLFSEKQRDQAQAFLNTQKDPGKCYLEDRLGKNMRCEDYCDCNQFCNFYKGLNNEQ
jgi:hypothetical protein